jgi:hypothetical protein
VLDDDGNIESYSRSVAGVARNQLGILKIVEAQVMGSARWDHDPIRSCRLSISEEKRNRHMRIGIARVQQVGHLVGDKREVLRADPERS